MKKITFFLGPALAFLMILLPSPAGLSVTGWRTAAIGIWMAVWWLSEVIPMSATALLPIVLFPLMGVMNIANATKPYANPLIFLFMGGFLIATAMQRWDLHRRIALNIINFTGTKPSGILWGIIIASAFLSMWVSNTATALLMLPIGTSVVVLASETASDDMQSSIENFEVVLLLSIAFACNIGGMGTIIGTPPNALLVGMVNQNFHFEIGFWDWMKVGVPLVVISLPIMYWILTKIAFPVRMKELPGGREFLHLEMQKLGKMSKAEKKVAVIFCLAALLWITRPLIGSYIHGLSDAGVAVIAGLSLFIIPENFKENIFLLDWNHARKIPWGILLLFGGGLSLAAGIEESGLAKWIGQVVGGLSQWPIMLLIMAVIVVTIVLTQLASNTGTAAAFLPVLASAAIGIHQNPLLLTIPAALAASCAFMLPVSTPPNAIVYSSGKITINQMIKAGLWLNVIFVLLLTVAVFGLVTVVFGVHFGQLPGWALGQ
jgi:sodium-dependent dicarboxylate transporter 2/3/5